MDLDLDLDLRKVMVWELGYCSGFVRLLLVGVWMVVCTCGVAYWGIPGEWSMRDGVGDGLEEGRGGLGRAEAGGGKDVRMGISLVRKETAVAELDDVVMLG